MGESRLVVLDASVGVKWFKSEPGSESALGLLTEHRSGVRSIAVAEHFVHEVIAVALRHGGMLYGRQAWKNIEQSRLTAFRLDGRLADASFRQCELLGCSFYDALAPALASELGAELWSADARAHAGFEGVRLIG